MGFNPHGVIVPNQVRTHEVQEAEPAQDVHNLGQEGASEPPSPAPERRSLPRAHHAAGAHAGDVVRGGGSLAGAAAARARPIPVKLA